MGNCLNREVYGSPNLSELSAVESKAHQGIQDGLIRERDCDKKTRKLLLLGSGSSGKSTLFKQLKCIHGWGFEDNEFIESRNYIRSNIVLASIKLLHQSETLYLANHIDERVDLSNAETNAAVQLIVSFKDESFEWIYEPEFDWNNMERLAAAIELVWNMSVIQKTYAQRGRFALPDNMDYFMARVTQIFGEEYYPNHNDVLKTRIRTSGLIETKYNIHNVMFHIVDVGGQRNERRKWIHSFENVTAVLFVSALNHYNRVLFEDEGKNAMHESLALFAEIMDSKWFRKMEMILFLNKKDLFADSIREGVSLSVCFNAEKGWDGAQWDDSDQEKYPTYTPQEMKDDLDPEVDKNLFEQCYKAALQFITNAFLSFNPHDRQKRVFVHVTDATDRDQIEKVFMDVQDIVIRANLKRGGFI